MYNRKKLTEFTGNTKFLSGNFQFPCHDIFFPQKNQFPTYIYLPIFLGQLKKKIQSIMRSIKSAGEKAIFKILIAMK